MFTSGYPTCCCRQGPDPGCRILPRVLCCHQEVRTSEVGSTPEQGAWCREQCGAMELWHCCLLLSTELVEMGQVQPPHTWASTAAYTDLWQDCCSSTVPPWPNLVPALVLILWRCESLQGVDSAKLTLPKEDEQFQIDPTLLLARMQLLKPWASWSHQTDNQRSGLEVWDHGNFSLHEVRLPWNGILALFSFPTLSCFCQLRVCFSQGRECFPLCVCALPSKLEPWSEVETWGPTIVQIINVTQWRTDAFTYGVL